MEKEPFLANRHSLSNASFKFWFFGIGSQRNVDLKQKHKLRIMFSSHNLENMSHESYSYYATFPT